MISRSIERLLRLPSLAALLAIGAGMSSAAAQSTYDAALYQPVSSSQVEARRIVTLPGGQIAFGTGDYVEVALPVDELGRRVVVSGALCRFGGFGAQGRLEILGRAVPGGALTSLGLYDFDPFGNPIVLPVPTRLASIRFVHRQTSGTSTAEFQRLHVYAWESSRPIAIEGHGWYASRPAPGAWTSFALSIDATSQDNFGLLFASVGAPLLGTPIFLSPTVQGGLLLDPANLFLVDARPLLGTGAWPFAVSFPYDPAVLSAPIHLQAVLGDAFSHPSQPLLFWTRPVTIHS